MPTEVLGPWSGGLNLVSNRESSVGMAKNELAEATNVCFTLDGNIEPRPGFKVAALRHSIYQAGATFTILGSVQLPGGGIATIVQRLLGTQTTVWKFLSVYNNAHPPWGGTTIILMFNPPDGTVFTHAMSLNTGITGHKGIVLFSSENYKSYINPNFDLTGTWTLIPAAATPTTATKQACGIPGSDGGMVVKNRLFLWKFNTSRFAWSPPGEVLDWSGNIDPDPTGHGNDITRGEFVDATHPDDPITGVEFNNNLFYIFKRTKFYTFTYQINPTEDGYLRKVSDEGGVLSSTTYRGNIVVLSNKGVFRLDGVNPIDLQARLNLRFEFPLDNSTITRDEAFITDFNNHILIGLKRTNTYYAMNGETGAWSKWDFNYMDPTNPTGITAAAPGSKSFICQEKNSDTQHLVFTNFDKTRLVYAMHKPYVDLSSELMSYHYFLDMEMNDITGAKGFYIPNVSIKTKASFGESLMRHKKIQRVFVRFYLSDIRLPLPDYPIFEGSTGPTELWTAKVNFNDYRDDYDTSHDPAQTVKIYPMDPKLPFLPPGKDFGKIPGFPTEEYPVVVYQRAYQLPFHQMRASEFTFSMKRAFSKAYYVLQNPDSDRPAKEGYYFLLSGVWFDYLDKAGI